MMNDNPELLRAGRDADLLRIGGDTMPVYAFPPAQVGSSSARLFWQILWKRRGLVAVCTIAGIVLAIVAIALIRPTYEASGRVAVGKSYDDEALGFKTAGQSNLDEADVLALDTQIDILQSSTMALQAVNQLHLADTPDFRSRFAWLSQHRSQPPSALIQTFHSRLDVSRLPRSRIIEIRYDSTDPQLAAKTVNTLADLYIDQNDKAKVQSAQKTASFLSSQLDDLRQRLETSEQKLVDYQKAHGILGLDEKENIITSKLNDLNKDLTAAETDRIQKETNYRLSRAGDPELIYQADQTSLLPKLKAQQAELQSAFAEANTIMGSAHPKVQQLKSQLDMVNGEIDKEVHHIAARFQADYLAANKREQMLRDAMATQKSEANKLNEDAIEYNLLKRDAETSRQLYEGLLSKLKEADISERLRNDNIRLIDYAQVPVKPIRPKPLLYLAFGVFAGFLCGIGSAVALEKFDQRVNSLAEVEAICGLRPLAAIPLGASRKPRLNGRRVLHLRGAADETRLALVAHAQPRSRIAESYRSLRTSILLSAPVPPRVILLTSSLPQEGKTTTSINLATVLAEAGSRVLLIDADLRAPQIGRSLGIESDSGLTAVLERRSRLDEAIVECPPVEGLYVLPAGPRPQRPAELLGSSSMRDLLLQAREDFDYVVLDTPPASVVTDPVLLSPLVDSVLLIVRAGHTPGQVLMQVREMMQNVKANLGGIVLNAIDPGSPEYPYLYARNYYDDRTGAAA